MKRLRLFDKYKYIDRFGITIHCRVYKHDKLETHVFVEVTKSYRKGETYRTWYCPNLGEYKGHKKIVTKRVPKIFEGFSGCAGLGYWFKKHNL